MYTILVNQDNTLTTSIKERIMQRSKLMNTLHFLVEPKYTVSDYSGYDNISTESDIPITLDDSEEIEISKTPIIDENGVADMSRFTVLLEYILPVSKEYHSDILVKTTNEDGTDKLYKGKLEYKLPFDTKLTKEAGDIECKLTFTAVDLDENDNSIQYVRKTSETSIHITAEAAWSNIIPDDALNAIDQRLIKTDAQIKALEEMNEITAMTKADNIKLDGENNELYLTAEGNQIGDKVKLSDLGDSIVQSSSEGLVTMMI